MGVAMRHHFALSVEHGATVLHTDQAVSAAMGGRAAFRCTQAAAILNASPTVLVAMSSRGAFHRIHDTASFDA
jgi:hypothetical protein